MSASSQFGISKVTECKETNLFKCRKHSFYLKNTCDGSSLHFRPGVSNHDQGKCIRLELYFTFKLSADEEYFNVNFPLPLTLSGPAFSVVR